MAQFYTLLTEIGQAKLANAIALNQTIEITELAVGDGGGNLPVPEGDEEQLVNEVRRASINTSHVDDDNPSWIVVEQVIPPDVGGWTIREVGIYDVDGDLIAYGNYPETYKPALSEGSSRTQTVRMVLQVSDTAAVTLKVDPSVVLATRKYADDGDAAVKAEIEQKLTAAGFQFSSYDADRTYTTGEIVRGSNGQFYEFYDRDGDGTVQGIDPTDSASRPHIWMEWYGVRPGTVIEWRSETLPEGYIENDGAEVSRTDYRRIYAAFGTNYGSGDGSTTFNLPDDRGEFKRGWDHGRGVDVGRSLPTWQKGSPITGDDSGQNNVVGLLGDIRLADMSPEFFDPPTGAEGVSIGYATADTLRIDQNNPGFVRGARPRNNAVIYLTKI